MSKEAIEKQIYNLKTASVHFAKTIEELYQVTNPSDLQPLVKELMSVRRDINRAAWILSDLQIQAFGQVVKLKTKQYLVMSSWRGNVAKQLQIKYKEITETTNKTTYQSEKYKWARRTDNTYNNNAPRVFEIPKSTLGIIQSVINLVYDGPSYNVAILNPVTLVLCHTTLKLSRDNFTFDVTSEEMLPFKRAQTNIVLKKTGNNLATLQKIHEINSLYKK